MTRHTCADIRGMLNNFKRKGSMKDIMTDTETGRCLTDAEARNYLNDRLAKGWKVIPMCDCNNFDYQSGCKGHVEEGL